MTEGIIVALISAFVSAISSVSALLATQKVKKDKMQEAQDEANKSLKHEMKENFRLLEKSIQNLEVKYEKETAVISLKISELQKEQEKSSDHEKRIAVLEDKLKSAHHRIDSLEERIKF